MRKLQGLGLWNPDGEGNDDEPLPEWTDDQVIGTSTASYGLAHGSIGGNLDPEDEGEEDDLTQEDLEALRTLQVVEEDDVDKILGQGISQSLPVQAETSIEPAALKAPHGAPTKAAEPAPPTSAGDPLTVLAEHVDWTSARQEALGLGAVGVRRRRGANVKEVAGEHPATSHPVQPAAAAEPPAVKHGPSAKKIAPGASAPVPPPSSTSGDAQADKPDAANLRVTEEVAELLQTTRANSLTLTLDQLQDLGLAARARPRDTIRRVLQPWLADVTAQNCFPGWTLIWEADNLLCTRLEPLPVESDGSDRPDAEPLSPPRKTRSRRFSSRAAAVGAPPTDALPAGAAMEPEAPAKTIGSRDAAQGSGAGPHAAVVAPSDVEQLVQQNPDEQVVVAKGLSGKERLPAAAPAAAQALEDDSSVDRGSFDQELEVEFIARVEAAVAARVEQVLGERTRQMEAQIAAFERVITAAAARMAEQPTHLPSPPQTATALTRHPSAAEPITAEGDEADWIPVVGSSPVSGWDAIRQGDRVLPPLLLLATGVIIGIAMPIAAWMTAVLTPLAVCLVYLIGRRDETGQMSAGAALAAGLALLYAAERFRAGHLEATLDALARALGGS